MANQPRSKPWNQFPSDPGLGDQSKQCLDWIVAQLNQLIGQANVPPGQSLQSFGTNVIDPKSAQIISGGSRTSAIASGIQTVVQPTQVQFFWDGSNGSQPFTIHRDDGTIFGPSIVGSGLTVTGLIANTLYFFYPYFDEIQNLIIFTNIPGVSVGTPAIAFTAQNVAAAHQQILRQHIPLAALLSSVGITTPNAGTTNVFGGSGGSSSGLGGNGKYAP